jgi:ferrochelatase
MNKRAILLVNLGSPNNATEKDVKEFLNEFLNDKEVIDYPWLFRKILVNGIIIPFRLKHSTSLYKKLWTKEGSPLVVYSESLKEKLNARLTDTDVYSAMRYGLPSLKSTLNVIKNNDYEDFIILPVFPQYATSTTKSTIDFIEKEMITWEKRPKIKLIQQFYSKPAFINAVCSKIREHDIKDYDHILFSYHALPNRQLNKVHPKHSISACTCSKEMPKHGEFCYKATCYQTSRLIAKELELDSNCYTTAFQSRMSKNWTKPFTVDTLIKLAKEGKKKVLIISPAFVTDCLETIIELAEEGQEIFRKHGGEKLQLVENLNDSDVWLDAIIDITSN